MLAAAALALLLLGGEPRWRTHALPAAASPLPPAPTSQSTHTQHAYAHPPCETLLLAGPQPAPHNARDYETTVVQTARALSGLIQQNIAAEASAAALAQAAASTPLDPPPAAVALGAPQLKLGILYFASPPHVVVFQQNNSASLQQYWRTLASPWNATDVIWSSSWRACDGWWGGVAAAWGGGPLRSAAALFRKLPSVACDAAVHSRIGGEPRCDPRSTDCEVVAAGEEDEYRCRCRAGWWRVGGGGWVRGATLADAEARLSCTACDVIAPEGAECAGQSEGLRAAMLAANLAGMLLTVVIAVVIFKKRKCKAVAMGMWTVLQVILLGAFLMYASAGVQHAESARVRCVAGAWLRELGYVACYGSIVLRLWVSLAEFRTRKAHRWTPRDSEVLRVLGAMLAGAACYLAAFTATAACGDGGDGEESGGADPACTRAAWHHVTAAAEILLLVAGARIAHAVRNANVPFQERGWLLAALAVEGLCGVGWRLAAATTRAAPELWPPAATARAHLSAGVALACVFIPRLWHGWRAGRSLAQEVSRRGPAEGFGCEGEEGAEPSSEEVRAELKRIYTQLEMLRDKTLRHDNPHISKRRGGRKHPHRRFSLQALQARRGAKGRSGGTAAGEASEAGDASRTPEDSVCSVEGPSHYTDGDTQA